MTGIDDRRLERRRFLGAVGAGATVGVAGCLGDEGDGSEGGNGGGDGENGEAECVDSGYDPNVEDHPGDEPIPFTDDQHCAVCNMRPTWTDWYSQLAHEDGTGAVFDTPGCLFAYVVATTSDSGIAGAWVVDFETGELVDATEVHFVLVTDANAADDPMDINPRPFADREDAIAYLEEWDAEELTEDDVVGFEDVDCEVASIYRGNRI